MSFDSALARFRTRQADQFSDTVIVSRQIGETTTDHTTGDVTRDFAGGGR